MSALIEKAKTAAWFAARPAFWPHMVALTLRKFDGSAGHEQHFPEAEAWAAERAVSIEQALRTVGVLADGAALPDGLPDGLIAAGEERARRASVEMGGPGDLDLIHQSILVTGAQRVIETGVAYGWSSMAALSALVQTGGRLVSVDMPYPKANNEAFVGIVVPDEWRDRWTLIREPDRNGIRRALERFDGEIDLAHFDSDKSYKGRMFAYPLLWNALRPGGLFISDDIQDNFGFRDFCAAHGLAFAITESDGKYVGLAMKPVD
ncbi:MAG: class I SAM-dependent methyltransferase [Blastomonas sp.]